MQRILIAVTFLCVVTLGLTPALAGEPYAPKVAVAKNIKPGSMEYISVSMVNAAKVPDREEVEVPPYPGAVLIQTAGNRKMTANDEEYTCIHYMKLLTMDEGEKVIAYYKDKLRDYKFVSEFDGAVQMFWNGKDGFNVLDIRDTCTSPNVSIGDASGMWDELMPGAKTIIEITYIPRK